ncbi:long-chain fatty acid--CoA ligase [Mycobacterium florentinum]|uniref:Long-chain fatty acid--CoA ligase n=1 Tax=Mycobacterium florentinum TaxID=292462 RepID=A0A1X1UBW6_MYCFL|nr:class I adenylate-forming enzyme family protein [Mycobacterium florentinum]MCV7412343.1 acyl--CoA ligase [Mycobacterium florentinum]ORV54333.1 long-chain fatty acid--CoA ligase [Mycobacterium florentinum]BBX81723.1 AMP-binding protein [Mycobacterium florentinum]
MTAKLSARLDRSYLEADTSVALEDYTVGALLAARASTHGAVTALVGPAHGDGAQVRLTYRELFDEACRVATALTSLTKPGDYVALWAPNVVEWPIIQYGAALAGVVLVALNPALRPAELAYALGHSRAKVLIHADRSRNYDTAAVVSEIDTRFLGARTISLSSREEWRSDAIDAAAIARAPADPELPVMLQYTSGTTGRPKGVLLRHRSLVNVAKLTLEGAGIPAGAVTVNPLPMFHTAACVIGTLGPLWIGGTEVLVDRFEATALLDTMRRECATVLFFVPTILTALVAAQRDSGERAPRLSTCLGGASTVSAGLIQATEQTFGATVVNVFGQTELSPVLTATRPDDNRADQLRTVGRPLPQVECKVVDPATGAVVPVGQPGEICARGYQQMIGYLHDPDATAAAVDADGFLHTGDLGVMDERGYLTHTGRLKDLIIRGGENIAPAEIEACLADHEMVAEACAFGLPDDRLGEIVAVIVIARSSLPADAGDQFHTHASQHLTPHKIPQRWFVADELPKTPTGKVRKFALPDLIAQGGVRELFRKEPEQ